MGNEENVVLTGVIDRRWLAAAVVVVAALFALPSFIPPFYVYTLALIFVTGLLAMSLNLVLGYGGLYQFHHGVFYGVGAYAVALALKKASLPAWLAFIAGPIAAALLGLLIGWFCIRLTQLYFGMLQISLGSLVWAIVFRWYSVTGGDDGIHGIPIPSAIASLQNSYYFTLAIFALSLAVLYLIIKSPFGATLQATRDNPQRCEAVGVNVKRHQLIGIVIASFFAGVAGVLFVVLEHSVFPDLLFWVLSLEIFIMCLLGGWFTFLGPAIGAAVIVLLQTYVGSYTEYWTAIMGVLLILLIFFLPEGVMGFVLDKVKGRAKDVEVMPAPSLDTATTRPSTDVAEIGS